MNQFHAKKQQINFRKICKIKNNLMSIPCASEYQSRMLNSKTYSSKIPRLKQTTKKRNKKFLGHLRKTVVHDILG